MDDMDHRRTCQLRDCCLFAHLSTHFCAHTPTILFPPFIQAEKQALLVHQNILAERTRSPENQSGHGRYPWCKSLHRAVGCFKGQPYRSGVWGWVTGGKRARKEYAGGSERGQPSAHSCGMIWSWFRHQLPRSSPSRSTGYVSRAKGELNEAHMYTIVTEHRMYEVYLPLRSLTG